MAPCCLLETLRSDALNAHTLHRVPATPSSDHHPQLPPPPTDCDHLPPGALDLGVAIGAALRRIQVVIAISINVAIYLFFLAGGIGVLAFEPDWLQNIAAFVPLTYGRHALEQAVFYSASDQFALDMTVLTLSALAALVLGTLSMRRGIAS